MTDWIEHNGGPKPVGDDVWVEAQWAFAEGSYFFAEGRCFFVEPDEMDESGNFLWEGHKLRYRIINQHLIDAARLEGIRLGLEAAMKIVWKEARWMGSDGPRIGEKLWLTLRNLNPDTIAKEAQHD